MKVIFTGATGFVGNGILDQVVHNPSITEIVCLTRRALPEPFASNPKIKSVIIKDFLSYPPEVLSQLEGAEACIWALGSPAFRNSDIEACRKIEIDYPRAAAEAITSSLSPQLREKGKTFRFVLVSGAWAERDPSKKLWYLSITRKIKGEVENALIALQQKKTNNFEITVIRPSGLLPKTTAMPNFLIGLMNFVKLDTMGSIAADEVVGGVSGFRTLEVSDMKVRARKLSSSRK